MLLMRRYMELYRESLRKDPEREMPRLGEVPSSSLVDSPPTAETSLADM